MERLLLSLIFNKLAKSLNQSFRTSQLVVVVVHPLTTSDSSGDTRSSDSGRRRGSRHPNSGGNDDPNRERPPNRTNNSNGSQPVRQNAAPLRQFVGGKKPKIKDFDGEDISSAALWLMSFQNATNTMRWTSADKAANFQQYLTGSAAEWFKNHFGLNRRRSAEDLLNPAVLVWEDIVHAFYDRFLGRGAAAQFIDMYNSFAARPSENWLSMCQRYRTIAEMAYSQLSDEDKIQNLATKFGSKDANIAMQMMSCQTLEELEKVCKTLDLVKASQPFDHMASQFQRSNQPGPNTSTKSNDDNGNWNGSNRNNWKSRNNKTQSQRGSPKRDDQSTQPTVDINTEAKKITNDKHVNKSPFQVRCFNCWQIGHFYQDCQKITGKEQDPVRIARNYERIKNYVKPGANNLSCNPKESDYQLAQCLAIDIESETQVEGKRSCAAITTPFTHKRTCQAIREKILKPSMYVYVAGIVARALCDTGSDYSHVSGSFAKKLSHLKTSKWDRPRLYAVNEKEVTPRNQLNSVPIIHPDLKFVGRVDLGIIKEQSYDLLIGMDLMSQVGLVIVTPLSTFMVIQDFQKLFENNGSKSVRRKKWLGQGDSSSEDETKGDGQNKDKKYCHLVHMDPYTFNDDVAQWKLQPADDIKTVVGDPTCENISEPSDPSDNNKTCQSVGRKEVNSYCQTLDFNHLKPREVKAVRVRPIDPSPKPSLLTIDRKISEECWSVQGGLLPANTDDSIVYIENLTGRAKTLNKNATKALLEEIDDSHCVKIDFPGHTVRRPSTILREQTQETIKRHSLDEVTSIDERIWSEINAYPTATERLFRSREQTLTEDDQHFERVNNDVSSDLKPRQRYLTQGNFVENTNIYAFQVGPEFDQSSASGSAYPSNTGPESDQSASNSSTVPLNQDLNELLIKIRAVKTKAPKETGLDDPALQHIKETHRQLGRKYLRRSVIPIKELEELKKQLDRVLAAPNGLYSTPANIKNIPLSVIRIEEDEDLESHYLITHEDYTELVTALNLLEHKVQSISEQKDRASDHLYKLAQDADSRSLRSTPARNVTANKGVLNQIKTSPVSKKRRSASKSKRDRSKDHSIITTDGRENGRYLVLKINAYHKWKRLADRYHEEWLNQKSKQEGIVSELETTTDPAKRKTLNKENKELIKTIAKMRAFRNKKIRKLHQRWTKFMTFDLDFAKKHLGSPPQYPMV